MTTYAPNHPPRWMHNRLAKLDAFTKSKLTLEQRREIIEAKRTRNITGELAVKYQVPRSIIRHVRWKLKTYDWSFTPR